MVYMNKKKTFKKSYRKFKKPKRLIMSKMPENKHFDVNISQSITQAGTLNLLSQIGQGVDDTQRIGNTLYLKSLFMNVSIVQNAGSTIDNVRLMVVVDRQGFNAPAVNSVLEPALLTSTLAPLSQYNHYYMSRYKVIYDRTLKLSTGFSETLIYKKYIPLKFASHYIGAATTFKNQVYLLHIGDNPNVLALPVLNVACRIIYTDS